MSEETDFPYISRRFRPGENNCLSDVAGVSVGHTTLSKGPVQTGVTAILPHQGNMYTEKLPAACHVINGYGKTTGLLQIGELGTIETPIILTNTLSVGTAYTALVRHMLKRNERIGREAGTVNPVIGECNDGYLNDIRGLSITEEHVKEALEKAGENAGRRFDTGAVGAGRGMSCYEMKGGIGTASRIVPVSSAAYTLGVLVLTNFGTLEDFAPGGRKIGSRLKGAISESFPDRGSVIIIIAVDAPLSARQLGRLSRRAVSGLARTGAYIASGSGEIALAFSTNRRIPAYPDEAHTPTAILHEDYLDPLFLAVTEAVEEAVLDSLISAETVTGRDGHVRYSLRDLLERYKPDITEGIETCNL